MGLLTARLPPHTQDTTLCSRAEQREAQDRTRPPSQPVESDRRRAACSAMQSGVPTAARGGGERDEALRPSLATQSRRERQQRMVKARRDSGACHDTSGPVRRLRPHGGEMFCCSQTAPARYEQAVESCQQPGAQPSPRDVGSRQIYKSVPSRRRRIVDRTCAACAVLSV